MHAAGMLASVGGRVGSGDSAQQGRIVGCGRGSSGSVQGSVECKDAGDGKGTRQRRGRAVVA